MSLAVAIRRSSSWQCRVVVWRLWLCVEWAAGRRCVWCDANYAPVQWTSVSVATKLTRVTATAAICGSGLQHHSDDPLLLDTSPGPEIVVSHVQRGRQFWLPIVAIGLAALGIWGLAARGSTSESEQAAPPEDRDESEVVVPEVESGQPTANESANSNGNENPDQLTSTTVPESAPIPSESAPVAPILGQSVGYDLLVSTNGRPVVLDLDQGNVTAHEGGKVNPVAITGQWLILESRTGGSPEKLPLDNLGGDPSPVLVNQELGFANAMPTIGEPEPGTMWFSLYRENANGSSFIPSLELVDLSSGETVFHPLAAEGVQTIDLFGGRYANGPEGLMTGPSGGVYQARQDGYRLVAPDGRLIAADQARALVETCDARMSCQRAWYDTATWEPLELRVPDRQAFLTYLMPPTDWVLTVGLADLTQATMLNIATGRTLDLQLPESPSSLPIPAVSPDGRWLAQVEQDSRSVLFRDLLKGNTTTQIFEQPIEPPLFFIAD